MNTTTRGKHRQSIWQSFTPIATALLALVLLIVLTACGGGEQSLTEQTGCGTLTEESTEELYVLEKYACDSDATVYTFNNEDGKDGWLEIALTFGTKVLAEGDTWVKVAD
jgi:hypothetical protein